MSTIADVIAEVRIEINDLDSTRFQDSTILALTKQAIRRANRICQRSQLQFSKKKIALQTVANQNYVTMPTDMDIPIGIWNDATHTKLTQRTETEWEQIIAAGTVANWFLDLENSKILFNATPTSVMDLTLWYFPTCDPSAYTVASTMPWGGKLDDIIARYVALRIQNIEEQNIQVDQTILQDMEQSIVSTYAPQSPLVISGGGWM